MAPGNNCQRIVRTRPGEGTGETLYQTEDGRWWREAPAGVVDSTSPSERRYLHNDHACTHRR